MTGESSESLLSTRGTFGVVFTTLLAIAAAVTVAQDALSPRFVPVDIRFCNATPDVLGNFTLTADGWRLGDIAPGRCSAFVRVTRGYANMGFSASIGATRYDVWPEDHVGDRMLASGRHTFAVRVTEFGLRGVLVDDRARATGLEDSPDQAAFALDRSDTSNHVKDRSPLPAPGNAVDKRRKLRFRPRRQTLERPM